MNGDTSQKKKIHTRKIFYSFLKIPESLSPIHLTAREKMGPGGGDCHLCCMRKKNPAIQYKV